MFKKIFQHHFFQGSLIITAATFFVNLLSYGFNLLVAKGTTLANYGEYYSVFSYITLFTIPFGAFGTLLIRKIGSIDPHQRHAFGASLEKWMYDKLFANAIFLLLIGAVIFFLMTSFSNLQMFSILFILAMSLFTLLQTFYLATFQAYKVFVSYGVFMISLGVLKLIGGGVVILFFPTLPFLYASIVIMYIFNLLIGHFILKNPQDQAKKKSGTSKTKAQSIQFQKIQTYLFRKSTLIPLLTTLGIIGIANFDVVLVKKLMNPAEAGLYGATSLLSKIIFYVAAPFAAVSYVFFTGKEHKHQSNLILLGTTGLMILIGAAAIFGYTFFSPLMIRLFFDQRFSSLQTILWLGGIYGTFYALITLYSQYFIAKNSSFSLLSLVAVAGQMVGLYLFHANLSQVLLVNISISGMLFAGYFAIFLKYFYRSAETL